MNTIETDVLVIGGGAAGIRAALAASEEDVRVFLVTKKPLTTSGSTFATLSPGWGFQALYKEERNDENLEGFFKDIMGAGLGQCNPTLVRILVEESGPRLEDLISYGIRFRRDDNGNFIRAKGCFSDYPRAFLTEDLTNIKQSFLSKIRHSPIQLFLGEAITLIIADETCWGAWIYSDEGRLIRVGARATVLANGGGAGLFEDHLVGEGEVGEGYALAHRAGAECKNLEFIQFMLGLKSKASRRFLFLPDLRIPGVLKDSDGHDLLDTLMPDQKKREQAVEERQKHFPFSTRDPSCLVDLAVARARRENQKVLWNAPDPEPIDGPWEVGHFAHAFNGGVKIDERAESTIPGLFAAGEVAAGPHGAERIGGCMMTATQVFGARAGHFAALRAKRAKGFKFPEVIPEIIRSAAQRDETTPSVNRRVSSLLQDLKELFSQEVMLLRNAKGLQHCLNEMKQIGQSLENRRGKDPVSCMIGENRLLSMELICDASLNRKESLGPHHRDDFPMSNHHDRHITGHGNRLPRSNPSIESATE